MQLIKRGATGLIFHHRLRSRGQFLGLWRIFTWFSPSFAEKFFVQLLPTHSLPQRSLRPFLVWPSKKSLWVFLQTLVSSFEVKQRWRAFLRGFSGMLPRFSANQNVWGCACTPKILSFPTPMMKRHLRPRCPLFEMTEGEMPHSPASLCRLFYTHALYSLL